MIYFTVILCTLIGFLVIPLMTVGLLMYKEHLERQRMQKSLEGLLNSLKEDATNPEDEYLDNLLDIKRNKPDSDIH